MKPYIVTQADVDKLTGKLDETGDVMNQALGVVAFFLWPGEAQVEAMKAVDSGVTVEEATQDWPDGLEIVDASGFAANPVFSLSHAIRQIEELSGGIAAHMAFTQYIALLKAAVAAGPDSPDALYVTVSAKLKDWMVHNTVAFDDGRTSGLFFASVHTQIMAAAGKLAAVIDSNIKGWAATQDTCARHGINFDAVVAGDAEATKAVTIAKAKDMPVEELARALFMMKMSPDADQDVVAVIEERFNALQEASDGSAGGHVIGSFKPNFGGAEMEDTIRA